MQGLKAWFRRPSTVAFLAFTGLYALCMAFVFWGTWALDKAPVGPDAPTFYPVDEASRWLREVLAGGKFTPFELRHAVGGMYFWQELQYAMAGWLASLGLVFYLRGRRLSLLASYGGGAAFGLMGYAFTLYSAGHLGWFQWMVYGPFAFGLVDRAVRKGRLRSWALLGATLAWAGAYQPDLWLLFTALTFAYGAWCVLRERRTLVWKRLLLGGAVFAAATLFVGLPQFRHAVFHDLASRERQIADSSGRADENAKDAPAAQSRKDLDRWLFCTGWSLPPEDVLEFAIPEIHGGSNDPRVHSKPGNRPYVGRLGQRCIVPAGQSGPHPVTGKPLSAGDEFWMPYRQHSLYFGFITLLFAVAGVAGAFRTSAKDGERRRVDGEVVFWTCAAIVSLLCALGCFTPFYRIVYALPFGSSLRAPVKFVHLVELCTAILAGYGIETLRVRLSAGRKWVVPLLAALAVVNLLDLARVDAKYLAVQDVSFHRAANDAAEDVLKLGGGKVYVAVSRQEGGEVVGESLHVHLVEKADVLSAPDVRFILAGGTAFRESKELNAALKSGGWDAVGTYSVSQKGGIRRAPRESAAMVLLQSKDRPAPAKDAPRADRLAQTLTWLSILSTLAVSAWGLAPVFRRRRA